TSCCRLPAAMMAAEMSCTTRMFFSYSIKSTRCIGKITDGFTARCKEKRVSLWPKFCQRQLFVLEIGLKWKAWGSVISSPSLQCTLQPGQRSVISRHHHRGFECQTTVQTP